MALVTPDIPEGELKLFQILPKLKVVFDVGARTDLEYYKLRPNCEYHLFEPNPEFVESLREQAEGKPNIHINPFGLGDVEGTFKYNRGVQMFIGGEGPTTTGDQELPVKTLDWYCAEKGIKKIDFLKIDTEGYDYKVLLGGKETIPKCRYIQYEFWNDKEEFVQLLSDRFAIIELGGRNAFCFKK